jgi:hypothetical protein
MEDYGLVCELIKFIWKYLHLHIFFIYILQGKKNHQSNKKTTHVKNFENKVQILVIQKFITII